MSRLILDLCGGTGSWSKPYQDAGYNVRVIDPVCGGVDVRDLHHHQGVHGILAAPPCTVFCNAGQRWPRTGNEMQQAVSIVDACIRIAWACRPRWWALENPVGTLRRWLGPPAFAFDPCDYGDDYTKRTLLWGHFKPPLPVVAPVVPEGPNPIHYMAPGPERAAKRSITPPGFARAFFEANP